MSIATTTTKTKAAAAEMAMTNEEDMEQQQVEEKKMGPAEETRPLEPPAKLGQLRARRPPATSSFK